VCIKNSSAYFRVPLSIIFKAVQASAIQAKSGQEDDSCVKGRTPHLDALPGFGKTEKDCSFIMLLA
jgi:hypothetical protein